MARLYLHSPVTLDRLRAISAKVIQDRHAAHFTTAFGCCLYGDFAMRESDDDILATRFGIATRRPFHARSRSTRLPTTFMIKTASARRAVTPHMHGRHIEISIDSDKFQESCAALQRARAASE